MERHALIPKMAVLACAGASDTTILTVPAGKVVEIHAVNFHNRDTGSRTAFCKLTRSATVVNLSTTAATNAGLKRQMLAKKGLIAEAGDVIAVNVAGAVGISQPTASIHYTEWDIGEIPGIELKSEVGSITSTSWTTIVSTSASVPRIVIRDFLAYNTGVTTAAVEARVIRNSVNNNVEDFNVTTSATNNVGRSVLSGRWVLERSGANDADWDQRITSGPASYNYLLSYAEHSDP